MLFHVKKLRDGTRAVQAELRRDGVKFRSGWKILPAEGIGIEQRREAMAEVIESSGATVRIASGQVYQGEEK